MPGRGTEPLDFAIEQIWGPSLARGVVRAIVEGPVPEGWEVREQYWIVPNRASAQLLVPCDRRVAPRTLGDYARLRRPRKQVVRRAFQAAAVAGLPLSRDILRIVAPVGAPDTTVTEISTMVGAPAALATFGVRTAANAKPTLELRNPDGDPIGFVKLAWNSITRHAIENEARAIKSMGQLSRSEIATPRVLADGLVQGRPFVMTEPLPRGIRHVPASFSALKGMEALGPGAVVGRGAVSGVGHVTQVLADLERITSVTPRRLGEQAKGLAARVAASGAVVPVANFWHGDFVRWNTGRDPKGKLWLFDWETAQTDVPAGLDTLHWNAHTVDAMNPHSAVTRVGDSVERSMPMLTALGHSGASAAVVAAWYAAVLVANEIRLAESLKSWERIKHPESVLLDLLAWGDRQLMRAARHA